MKMTPRYAAFRGQAGSTSINLKSMSHMKPSSSSADDDDFSDFKSGLPPTPAPYLPKTTSQAPLLSTNLLVNSFSPTHQSNLVPNEIGSRLANYGVGRESSQYKTESLIGDEDKYSPLRAFLQNESQLCENHIEEDGDFGDFQGFTQCNLKAEHLAVFPTNGASVLPLPLSTNPISGVASRSASKPSASTSKGSSAGDATFESQLGNGSDDFGDFVSFGGMQSAPAPAPQVPVPKPATRSDLDFDLLNLDNSSQQTNNNGRGATTKPVSADSSLLYEQDMPITFHPESVPPLKTTLITGPSPPADVDPFSDFLSVPVTTATAVTDDLSQFKHKKGTPETMSVSSLDLGNYSTYTWEVPESGSKNKPLTTPKISKGRRSSPLLNSEEITDKYSVFKQEQEMETRKSFDDWLVLLETCLRLIEDGERLFQSVSSSDVLRQIIQTDKGRDYVFGLRQVYLVSCRVYHSWMRFGGNETLSELHQKLALAWDSMSPFLLGTNLEDDFRRRSPMSDDDDVSVCGICLVGTGWRDGEGEEEDSWRLSLDFGGTLYHLPCANLWINQVNSSLPILTSINSKKRMANELHTLI